MALLVLSMSKGIPTLLLQPCCGMFGGIMRGVTVPCGLFRAILERIRRLRLREPVPE